MPAPRTAARRNGLSRKGQAILLGEAIFLSPAPFTGKVDFAKLASQKTEGAMRTRAKIASARYLRKALTKPELWLWLRLRRRTADGFIFRNQHPVGPYVLDFYCARARLCIEVDGEIHSRDEQMARDAKRDAWLTTQGIHVHRVSAADLLADPDEIANGVINLAVERGEIRFSKAR